MRSAVTFTLCLVIAPGCVEDPASDESAEMDVVRVSASSPQRLSLRNYAQE